MTAPVADIRKRIRFTGQESKAELRQRLQSMAMILRVMLGRYGAQEIAIKTLESSDPTEVEITERSNHVRVALRD